MRDAKSMVLALPGVGPIVSKMRARLHRGSAIPFSNSAQYWEERYARNGTSGSGSYGRLARFKADTINAFVHNHGIETVAEFGCGDGAQLELADYPNYIGFDVSPTAVQMCRRRFAAKENYEFYLVGSRDYNQLSSVECALSLDVIYHLVEDDVYENYMRKLFSSSRRHVVIYSHAFDEEYVGTHELGRDFRKWVSQHAPDWALVSITTNPYPWDAKDPHDTSRADFYFYIKTP